MNVMEIMEFIPRIINALFNWHKNAYKEKSAKKIYSEIYAPIMEKLLPFLKNYDGSEDKDFANALHDCRKILMNNFKISNPVFIKKINRIINLDKKFKPYQPYSKRDEKKYQNLCPIIRIEKDKEYRKSAFEYFAHDIITEYSRLRKKVGIGKLSITHRVNLDQIAYQDLRSCLIPILVLLVFFLFVFIAIAVIGITSSVQNIIDIFANLFNH